MTKFLRSLPYQGVDLAVSSRAIGPLTCCLAWPDPISSPRFTPFAPRGLGPL
jgi:hypothetical protein